MKLTKEQFDLLRAPTKGTSFSLGSRVFTLIGKPYKVTFISGPDSNGNVCLMYKDEYEEILILREISDLRMPPEAWIQGKPAYIGDKIYYRGISGEGFIAGGFGSMAGLGLKVQISIQSDKKLNTWFNHTVLVEDLSWTPFTVKKEGWVNVYKLSPNGGNRFCGNIKDSKEELNTEHTLMLNQRVAVAKIEWEEEV